MRLTSTHSVIAFLLILMLSAQALASSSGPPESNMSGESTILSGCNCHGSLAPSSPSPPSTDVVLSISGVPHSYLVNETYDFTISIQHASNTAGGFMLSSGNVGTFSWSEGLEVRPADGSSDPKSSISTSDNISHSAVASPAEWVITWTPPETDSGDVSFYLAGNSVDDQDNANDGDSWNLLSFVINSPSDASAQENLDKRVISVGDYQSLFVSEPDPESIEHEKQLELADSVFTTGNTLYWASLCVLIVAAGLQREILERKNGDGPDWLAKELAYPQALRRGLISALFFIIGLNWIADGAAAYMYAPSIFIGFWAADGVYRTMLAAKAEKKVMDII